MFENKELKTITTCLTENPKVSKPIQNNKIVANKQIAHFILSMSCMTGITRWHSHSHTQKSRSNDKFTDASANCGLLTFMD